jgi:serine-type D-Ala-D-Ala carboxypeptidase
MITPNDQLSALLTEHIKEGDFPSAVYLVAKNGAVAFAGAIGDAVVEPYRIANKFDTIYDLASLTKPLITGLLCSLRVELGEVTLDSAISHYLPEFDRTDKQMITIRELLTHSSGLPAWRPLYILADNEPERAIGAIASLDLEYAPGSRVLYSDLGFITLGVMLERLTGKRLGEMAQHEIFTPLKLENSFFNPEMTLQTGIAASETGNAYERGMCEQTGAGVYQDSRQRIIWGEVHDGNAYFLGGAAGHAGLFSTAQDTLVLAQQFIADFSTLLNPETCQLFRVNMTANLEEARSIGWQLASSKESTAGLSLPPDSFGHNGFTGTSLWIDAERGRVFILLTNRTHARLLPFANINGVRREFHTLAAAALDQLSDML